MATISENLKISSLTVKIAELTEAATHQTISITDIPNTLEEIGIYSVALGDTEIARGTLTWEKGNANVSGWVPTLRYRHPEDDSEDGLSRVAMRIHNNRYPIHTGALEELDIMLSEHLTYTYNN